jgi:hypothetical protein
MAKLIVNGYVTIVGIALVLAACEAARLGPNGVTVGSSGAGVPVRIHYLESIHRMRGESMGVRNA